MSHDNDIRIADPASDAVSGGKPSPHRSLRFRLLGPVVLTACLAAIVVALASYRLGTRWAESQVQIRFDAIEETLARSSFPLNATVLASLARLTQTEMATFAEDGSRLSITLDEAQPVRMIDDLTSYPAGGSSVVIDSHSYLVRAFPTARSGVRVDGVSTVAVLFDQNQIEASQRRAMLLPLATGLSTIVALTTVTLLLGSRLVGRLGRLKRRVEAVAAGDFRSTVSDRGADEVGQLGGAVDAMASQLDRLWKAVNRQQSQKLLHQIAGGMAHQLRNSLTGARLAVELHAKQCDQKDDEGLEVAVHQIEVAEDYVRRLLLVSTGRQHDDRPQPAGSCIDDVRKSMTSMARHLRIDLCWEIADQVKDFPLRDGPTWVAAATNLIDNAMQAGDRVRVTLTRSSEDLLVLRVADNGGGIADPIAAELFEPFVTSKPEGMGLGLSVVKRAAEHLGGDVRWFRERDWTIFELTSSA